MLLRAAWLLLAAASIAARASTFITSVDTVGQVGEYTSLQLNGANPVVSYYARGSGDLKLATCTADCAGANPQWIVATVDSDGDVGMDTSLQLNGGNPVIAYFDNTNGHLKLATCIAACATPAPSWVITVVDPSINVGRFPSLRLLNGNPVISYRDRANGDLKLATCTADCASASPTWVIVVVDGAGNVGSFTSMQLIGDRPVIAYLDFAIGTLKLATCTGGCATSAPSWAISAIDTVPDDDEIRLSLQLNGANPVISYYEQGRKRLKLATCTSDCAAASATWVVTVVDAIGDAGQYSSMQLVDGKPVIAYAGSLFDCFQSGAINSCTQAIDLRVAMCTADCATAAPVWTIGTLDNHGLAGWDPSLTIRGGQAFVSYYDVLNEDLKFAVADLADAAVPANHTALWWNFEQSGWGVNFAHQGDIVFGTLFTYEATGAPLWLVMPAGQKQPDGTFLGTLYRTTGPPFNAIPFTPIGPANVTEVGTMAVQFAGDTASLTYSVGGATVSKVIRKQVFGARAAICHAATASRASVTNYTDLWWNPAESGWGLNITQQGDVVFATLFTYDASGKAMWYVLPAAARQTDGSFTGDLYRTTGPAFNAAPWRPLGADNVTKVGSMSLRFADGENGTLAYSVDAVGVQKAITRQVFSSPVPACAS